MNNLQQFFNCRLLRNGKLINDNLWVRNGIIVDPEILFFDEKVKADKSIDCHNAIISPGYIDIQINGGFGIDFSYNVDNVEDGITKVAKHLLAHGVTSFCPTLVTSSPETYHKILPKIKKSPGGTHGATVLGVHVEGPFISPTKKGAHQEIYIKQFNKGFQSIVDVYGSLQNFHHRDPGLVGLLTSDQIPPSKKVYFGIIADGVHTHPAALRIAHRTHPEGLILVTDAISALGLQEGLHRLGQLDIEIKSNQAYIANTNTLCGNCSIVNALEAATLHPARALQIHSQKGTLNFGADADFLLLNDNLDLVSTWIAGECVYTK
ncbi:Similar to CG17065: N-acetylglucosamine-6-phosphate deacetylase (Drosophila melanogaster) [Cotesia congregata]|uniref:Similar to CG17065: N-acetylglucosamine-6-phosphate deacetylase (Drosophila melanogaster) n=1 Tax=Cotesia congregata TaxID=51543 RepID=A0A8J2EIV4_COTCN|nr:Similar to CG17065: N-acetylglucosamine-6-phosphate deacetylase (Drosophila melanogaster) [Cotesia congregata]